MEKHYQKENQLRDQYQSQPEAARYEFSTRDKKNLYKEIYSNIDLFNQLKYENEQDDH